MSSDWTLIAHTRASLPAIDDAPTVARRMATGAAAVCGVGHADARECSCEQNRECRSHVYFLSPLMCSTGKCSAERTTLILDQCDGKAKPLRVKNGAAEGTDCAGLGQWDRAEPFNYRCVTVVCRASGQAAFNVTAVIRATEPGAGP